MKIKEFKELIYDIDTCIENEIHEIDRYVSNYNVLIKDFKDFLER